MRKGGVPPNLTDERKILEKIISERQEGNFTANRAEDDKREAERQLLRICHLSADLKELIGHLIVFFKKLTDCQAVGIRLRQKEDFPYYESCGFAPHFIQKENYLCQRTPEGDIVLDSAGTPVLECMCGNVLRGRFDSSLPFFTERGSFWTNSTTELLAATSEADRQARTRSRCNGEGYESLALIPFRLNENVFGLLQLNDKTPGRFTPELISGLEDLAAYVSLSLSKHLSDIFRRESEERLQQALLVSRSYTFEWKPSPDQILRSDSCATILHLSGDEVRHDTGQRYFQKVHPDDRARLVQILHDLTPTASTYATEYRFVCSDNTIVVLEEVGQAAFDAAGKMERVVGVTTDVTERKQVEGNRRINPICANGKIDVPLSRKKGGVYGTCYRKRTGQETNQLAEAY